MFEKNAAKQSAASAPLSDAAIRSNAHRVGHPAACIVSGLAQYVLSVLQHAGRLPCRIAWRAGSVGKHARPAMFDISIEKLARPGEAWSRLIRQGPRTYGAYGHSFNQSANGQIESGYARRSEAALSPSNVSAHMHHARVQAPNGRQNSDDAATR